jgi:thiamine-phosphate pyrophosphorylase
LTVQGLYVILSSPQIPYEEAARICVEEGILSLQLREKFLGDRELLSLACRLREITAGSPTKLIIDDRPDIASLCKADGLHLGQGDIPPGEARRLFPQGVVGLSTHNIAQVLTANLLPQGVVQYIGFGPIYPTTTKANPDPVTGVENLGKAVALSALPVVALGGVDGTNLPGVAATGVAAFSSVRPLCRVRSASEFRERLRTLQRLWKGTAR